MIRLTITERGGSPKLFSFPKDEITIGRSQGNDIILPRNNISKRHTRILRHQGLLLVRDLDSTNGTFLNGRRIRGDEPLQAGDRIFLADFTLIVEEEDSAATPAPPESKPTVGPPLLSPADLSGLPDLVAEEDELSAIPLSPSDVETEPPEGVEALIPEAAAAPPPLEEAEPETRPKGRRVSEPRQARVPSRPPTEQRPGRDTLAIRAVEPVPAQAPAPAPPDAPAGRSVPSTPPPEPAPRPSKEPAAAKPAGAAAATRPAARKAARPEAPALDESEVRRRALARVDEIVNVESAEPSVFGDPELQKRIKSAIMDELFILESQNLLAPTLDRDALVGHLTGALFGLGPLPAAAGDPSMETCLVYPDGSVFKRRAGKWSREPERIDPQLVSLLGRRLAASADEARRGSLIDLFRRQHPDLPGLDVVGVSGGAAMRGAFLRLERPATFPEDLDRLADAGVLSVPMGTFLKMCVEGRQTIAVVGPKGGPRSALIRALAAALPPDERMLWMGAPGADPPSVRAVTVSMFPTSAGESMLDDTEDSPGRILDAVRWMQPGVVVIEPSDPGRDASLVDLVRTRMGAVVLGIEAERYDPAAAAAAALATQRSSVPPPSVLSGPDLRMARMVDVVVEAASLMDGTHRVRRIGERATEDGDPSVLTSIFEFVASGATETGEIVGEYRPTRAIPRFLERRRARGKRIDVSIFQG